VDWQATREHYEPLVARAENDQEFYRLLNQMLWELEVSHAAVGPVAMWSAVEPAIWMAGKTGLDVRLLEGEVVITRAEPGSPAEQGGLRPSFVLERVGSFPVEQIVAEAESERSPPYNEAGRIDHLTRAILAQINGPPDTCVTLTWRDEMDETHERCVERRDA
jgi:hypothetical protein